jgi:predicted ATPase
LSSAAILERLGKRLAVLTGGPRDAPTRQQTLRATIDWSYELLDDEERRLFGRLSVFSGGWTLAAAEQVCEARLDVLASLVDKNLVRAGIDRYWMLETIHEYALERLEESREADAAMHALAEYMVRIAREHPSAVMPEEIENVRAAITWALASSEFELALRLAAAAQPFRPLPAEHSRWLDVGLRRAPHVSPRIRADALAAASMSAYRLGDLARSAALGEQSLRLYR